MTKVNTLDNNLDIIEKSPQDRTKRDIRCILTQKCNYQCSFCHKEGCDGSEKELLHADDLAFLGSVAQEALKTNQITLSGGEPLIRKDIEEITKKLFQQGSDITIVTNGSLINKREAIGPYIKHINVSLHTTNSQEYKEITHSHVTVDEIIQNLSQFHQKNPHIQVKLNGAILKDSKSIDTRDFQYKMSLAKSQGWIIKCLELCNPKDENFVPIGEFETTLKKGGFLETEYSNRQKLFHKDGVNIITGQVFCSQAKKTADPEEYCKNYNDIYISPDGYLSACPMKIKKFNGYDAIIKRERKTLSQILLTCIDEKTTYHCPFGKK